MYLAEGIFYIFSILFELGSYYFKRKDVDVDNAKCFEVV